MLDLPRFAPAAATVGGGRSAGCVVSEFLLIFVDSGDTGLSLIFDGLPGSANAQIQDDAHGCSNSHGT